VSEHTLSPHYCFVGGVLKLYWYSQTHDDYLRPSDEHIWSAARSVRTRRFGCFESPPRAKAARMHRPRRTPKSRAGFFVDQHNFRPLPFC